MTIPVRDFHIVLILIMKQKAILLLIKLGVAQHLGSMEGKEIRFGSAATALWSVSHHFYFQWFGKWNARQSHSNIRAVVIDLDMMDQCALWRCWCRTC